MRFIYSAPQVVPFLDFRSPVLPDPEWKSMDPWCIPEARDLTTPKDPELSKVSSKVKIMVQFLLADINTSIKNARIIEEYGQ